MFVLELPHELKTFPYPIGLKLEKAKSTAQSLRIWLLRKVDQLCKRAADLGASVELTGAWRMDAIRPKRYG